MITAGEVLKNKRESLGRSLETVSIDTKIQRRFIQYMENNQFGYFDSEVFLTGFIKIYASYLGLDTEKVLALYRRSNPPQKLQTNKDKSQKPSKKTLELNALNPKTVITSLLVIFLISIITYIGFQIYKFQSPPFLEILEPKPDAQYSEEEIMVRGKTVTESVVEINGNPVELKEDGEFEKSIILKEGINVITVKSRKNNNNTLESVETRKVTYVKNTIPEEEERPLQNLIVLEVTNSPSWIKLDIDDENKLSQVIESSKLEYPINNTLYVITGRASNTKLYFNGQLIPWKNNQTTGVSELTCEITDGSLLCN
jgi:cytoskeletal protein RodZ